MTIWVPPGAVAAGVGTGVGRRAMELAVQREKELVAERAAGRPETLLDRLRALDPRVSVLMERELTELMMWGERLRPWLAPVAFRTWELSGPCVRRGPGPVVPGP